MNFLYTGCMTRRSTDTMTVLCALSLTTVPCRTRLGIPLPLRTGLALLREECLDTGNVAPHRAHAGGVLELPTGPLEAQVELLLLELDQRALRLVGRLHAVVFALHRPTPRPDGKRPSCGSAASPRPARMLRARSAPTRRRVRA